MYINDKLKIKCDNVRCGCKNISFMWISHALKCIYFETPKACSSSIRETLGIGYSSNVNAVYDKYSFTNVRKFTPKYSSYFKFAFVRNPWDRLVSLRHMYTYFGGDVTFNVFMNTIKTNSNHHWVPYDKFLYKDIQFIGRFENFKTDWQFICSTLKIKNDITKKNSNPHRHYSTYYTTDNHKQQVLNMFECDFTRFGYSTNLEISK